MRLKLAAARDAGSLLGLPQRLGARRGFAQDGSRQQFYLRDLAVTDRSLIWNTDLVEALELDNLIGQAAIVLDSALYRTESRGADARTSPSATTATGSSTPSVGGTTKARCVSATGRCTSTTSALLFDASVSTPPRADDPSAPIVIVASPHDGGDLWGITRARLGALC